MYIHTGGSKIARRLKTNKIASVAVPLNVSKVKSSGYGNQPPPKGKNVATTSSSSSSAMQVAFTHIHTFIMYTYT